MSFQLLIIVYSKTALNRWVFSFDLKKLGVSAALYWSRSLFQIKGAWKPKAASPCFCSNSKDD